MRGATRALSEGSCAKTYNLKTRGMGLKPLGRGLDCNLETARDLSEAEQKPATEYQRNRAPLTPLLRVCNSRSAARRPGWCICRLGDVARARFVCLLSRFVSAELCSQEQSLAAKSTAAVGGGAV